MKSPALRFVVAALFVGVLGGAAYLTWIEESAAKAAAEAARSFDQRVQQVSRALLEIKSAQPGYVAAGQGEEFWTARVDALLASAGDGLGGLPPQAQSEAGRAEIETAADAFDDFQQMDRRARGYARSGQRLLASDLVFSDGIGKVDAAVAALNRAREIELATGDARLREARRKQALALAAVAAFSLLTLFLLVPLPSDRSVESHDRAPRQNQPADELPLASVTRTEAMPEPAAAPVPAPPAPASDAPSVDLAGIASVCSDLARALERAAKLLQASGIVVWVADPDGRQLIPVVAHGYPPNLIVRLGTIDRDAENVTAAAFRTGVIQTMRSDASSPGAIAAPLLTPAGPVGVMAAEMLNERERHEQTLSATAIVAAQLATLMAPPMPPPGKAEARA